MQGKWKDFSGQKSCSRGYGVEDDPFKKEETEQA